MIFHFLIVTALVSNVFCDSICPSDWTLFAAGDKCLKKVGMGNWETAKVACEAFPTGSLVKIHNAEENQAVADLFPSYFMVWIGVVDTNNDGTYEFVDDTDLTGYTPWYNGSPGAFGDTNTCGILKKDPSGLWWRNNYSCTGGQLEYVCERDAVSICPSRWMHNAEDKVCVKVVKGKKRNFDDAREYCKNLGADLATKLFSREQRIQLMETVKFRSNLWIGVHDGDMNGVFEYIDGSTLDNAAAPFKARRPQHGSTKYCVTLKMRRWFDRHCDRKLYFICEKNDATVTGP